MRARIPFLGLAAFLALVAAAPAHAEGSITFINESPWTILAVYISPSSSSSWDDDLLGLVGLLSAHGGTFTKTDLTCTSYDIKLIDEQADECVVRSYHICNEDKVWHMSRDWLLRCQGYRPGSRG
ncbi:MAG TPA: hypothetical protein VHQ90_20785 [Thermoanaerobaculia bacterium]|nr:hypothetical protein [Thermoanaerobaculia bacterium]